MPKNLILCLLLSASAQLSLAQSECVVLLHGLLRVSNSMGELDKKLQRAGYSVANIGYSSRRFELPTLAEDAVGRGLAQCHSSAVDKVHFVTHSLGGILLRVYLEEHSLDALGSVVMLGPPNQGSEVVDGLSRVPGFGFLIGTAGIDLGTHEGDIVPALGPVDFDLGVIAGSTNVILLFSGLLTGPNDGIVSVESTKVEGMKQHLVLPVTHTLMMRNNEVIDHVIHYLKTGTFIPGY